MYIEMWDRSFITATYNAAMFLFLNNGVILSVIDCLLVCNENIMLSLIFGVANETETAVQYEDMIKC